MNKAIFLDRDGVINVEKNYVHTIDQFEFIDGIFDACRKLQEDGFLLIIITNQAGIARGFYNESTFKSLTQWMLKKFEENSVKISDVYFCPHHPDFGPSCECRKPKPGMILRAAYEHSIELKYSVVIGDKITDIQAAEAAQVGTKILVKTGHEIPSTLHGTADVVVDSIVQAANYIHIQFAE